ncbi:hypothetical protein FH972_021149 [Carpinus fangiana]|uniref:HhH-GPD domain-containing protein n=1 Tax=Carpinus fangiana TaxID=176857 RepID=A0A5N6KNJ9_9ROSI|nr:hypothetical protein FH972_021149 [Carpinus fangiana]
MATVLPPPSKRQKLAAEQEKQQLEDAQRIPDGLGDVRVQFVDQASGQPTGGPVSLPVAHANEDSERVPYRFAFRPDEKSTSVEEDALDISSDLYHAVIQPNLKSTEDVITLLFQPLSVFRVRAVTRCTASIVGHGQAILATQFSPGGSSRMVTGSGDSTARIWDCETGTPFKKLEGHTSWVLAVSYSPDGKHIATGSMDNTVRIWDAITGKQMGGPLRGHTKWVTSLCWEPFHLQAPGRPRLASSSKDASVRVWDVVRGTVDMAFTRHQGSVSCVKWGGTGNIYSTSNDKTVKIWNSKTGELVKSLTNHAHWVNHLALSTDFALRTAFYEQMQSVPDTDEEKRTFARERFEKAATIGGKMLEKFVTASDDCTMFLWDPSDLSKPKRMTGHQKPVNHVCFSPDGHYIASSGFDNKVKLWLARDGTFVRNLIGHVGPVYQSCFSGDSRLLVTASKDTTLKAWDVKTGKILEDLPGHKDEVFAVDWSPDGKRVGSGGKDKANRLITKPILPHRRVEPKETMVPSDADAFPVLTEAQLQEADNDAQSPPPTPENAGGRNKSQSTSSKRKSPRKSPYFNTPSPSKRPRLNPEAMSCMPFPPLSAISFGLIQERLHDEPFQLLIAVLLLNRTKGIHSMPVFFSLVEKYPAPQTLAAAPVEDIVEAIRHLGFQNQRARKMISLAQAWVETPPQKGRRFRTLNYPCEGDGKDIKLDEVLSDDDERPAALEIAHLPGVGRYAWDSWRIFCRDRLRGLAEDFRGTGAEPGFEPEWKRVLPHDKELRQCLRWMWLKENWDWDPLTGDRKQVHRPVAAWRYAGTYYFTENQSATRESGLRGETKNGHRCGESAPPSTHRQRTRTHRTATVVLPLPHFPHALRPPPPASRPRTAARRPICVEPKTPGLAAVHPITPPFHAPPPVYLWCAAAATGASIRTMPSRDPEPRRRRKEKDIDRDQGMSPKSPRERDRQLRSVKSKHSSTSSLAKEKDKDKERHRDRSPRRTASSSSTASSETTPRAKKQVTMIVPEMDRRSDDRTGSVYPSFSKAHSRESLTKSSNTPDNTDLGQARSRQGSSPTKYRSASGPGPPSPPLTQAEPDLRRAASGNNIRRTPADTTQDYMMTQDYIVNGRKGADGPSPRGLRPGTSLRHAEEGRSATPPKLNTTRAKSTSTSARGTPSKTAKPSISQGSLRGKNISVVGSNITDSDATSIAPGRKQSAPFSTLDSNAGSSPPSDNNSSPQTPKGHDEPYSPFRDGKTPIEVIYSTSSQSDLGRDRDVTPSAGPPPPPPPPAMNAGNIPRVDYLLQNGGLPHAVQKVFASAANPLPTQTYQQYSSPAVQFSKAADVQETFGPYSKLLDNFSTVISKNGSIAVATGYKSVARRLLDRLETVFARNISSETCPCAMCRSSALNGDHQRSEEDSGISWGEVLELVSGRRELPQWPPFNLPTSESGLRIANLDTGIEAPMQKLDIDVPEEYREHYIRQSQKTKKTVQRWLSSQPEEQATAPQEVDDETLMFAMLTYLEPDERRIFTALMRGLSTVPQSRTPTPAPTEPKTDFMTRIGVAIQRLYRLPKTPREPECAMYLLKNPTLHAALATLSAINENEWEVLVSGRFDGFLWSDSDDGQVDSRAPSRGPNATPLSRNGTPYSAFGGVPLSRGTPFSRGPSRGPTPGHASTAPVGFDEETEIARPGDGYASLMHAIRQRPRSRLTIYQPRDDIYGAYNPSHLHTTGPKTHTQSPSVTGTSVIGVKFDKGVVIAADNLASYGSLARFTNVRRLRPFNSKAVLGFGGDVSDMQALDRMLIQLDIRETYLGQQQDVSSQTPADAPAASDAAAAAPPAPDSAPADATALDAKNLHTYLSKVMYGRRTKLDPLWNVILVAGLDAAGAPFLASVDLLGTAFSSPTLATGFGAHLAQPILRRRVPDEAASRTLSRDEAIKLVQECMKVLYYRDARSMDQYSIAVVEPGKEVDIKWEEKLENQSWAAVWAVRAMLFRDLPSTPSHDCVPILLPKEVL